MSTLPILRSDSPARTEALGRVLGRLLGPGQVVGLVGELGAGKTCFARGVARGMGVDPGVRVTSPTFTIVNEYAGRAPLIHVDLYRLSDPEELVEVGLDEYFRGDGVVLVEWFDLFPAEMPLERLQVHMEVTGDETRLMELDARGGPYLELVRSWAATNNHGAKA